MNAVTKQFPWMPNITGPFDSENSMVEEDFKFLRERGFNLVRLGVMWPGVMPSQDEVNITYLAELEKLVNSLGEYGIYTMLDMHQDLLSAYYCGEGVPDWAVPYERAGVKPFPIPLRKEELPRDPETHYIDWDVCRELNFAMYYASDLVGNIFDCLYDSECNPFTPVDESGDVEKVVMLQQEMLNFWGNVSSYFKDNEYVLGYDLINEPSAGDLWDHPGSFVRTGKYEKEVLQPFYTNIMERVYGQDQNHIIFFEPIVTSITETGFDVGGPGAELGIPVSKQAYAWHLYCLLM